MRSTAMIHHCGIGTSAQALRAVSRSFWFPSPTINTITLPFDQLDPTRRTCELIEELGRSTNSSTA
jgi:hypothetical protein